MKENGLVQDTQPVPQSISARPYQDGKIHERRSCPRSPVNDPASMKVINPFSPFRWQIRILDGSPRGLKLRVPEFLHPGTAVQIRLEHAIALAEVRYCLASGAEFYVGVQIQDLFPRSQAVLEI